MSDMALIGIEIEVHQRNCAYRDDYTIVTIVTMAVAWHCPLGCGKTQIYI